MRIGRQLSAEHRDEPGPTVSLTIDATVDAVWQVLSDGWSYATWVVGTSRIRRVDGAWPATGSRIHHSFGLWPLVIDDFTTVEDVRRPDELVLTARGWPVGEARIHLSVRPDGPGRCVVAITEDAVSGPARLIPGVVRRLLIVPRNRETLNRLALLAEGRQRQSQP